MFASGVNCNILDIQKVQRYQYKVDCDPIFLCNWHFFPIFFFILRGYIRPIRGSLQKIWDVGSYISMFLSEWCAKEERGVTGPWALGWATSLSQDENYIGTIEQQDIKPFER